MALARAIKAVREALLALAGVKGAKSADYN
jgi:hypothetical protein